MSRTAFCSAQPAAIFPARNSPMPGTSLSFSGAGLDDFECRRAEDRDDPFGELRTDAAHHAGAEVFLDALGRRRRRGLERIRLELQAVRAIGDPDADGVDEFAGRDRSGVADDGDKIAPPARLHFQDREAALLIVKRHPLDRADERFTGGSRMGLGLQDASPSRDADG